MKAFKSIFRLSRLIDNTVRSIKFCVNYITDYADFVTSNFNPESKVIPSSFSLRLNAICALSKGTTCCISELHRT